MAFFGCLDKEKKKEVFEKQIGVYILDIYRTELGEYINDTSVLKYLTITFKEDSTFKMNMHAPFFSDSIGTWLACDGLAYSYNELFYQNEDYNKMEGEHFYVPYIQNGDTIFLIIGALPEKNKKPIHEIYFKKISGK